MVSNDAALSRVAILVRAVVDEDARAGTTSPTIAMEIAGDWLSKSRRMILARALDRHRRRWLEHRLQGRR